jgi:hypothetical protein
MTRLVALAALLGAMYAGAAGPAGAATDRVPSRFTGVMWDRDIQDAPRAVQEQQWTVMARSGVGSVRAIFAWHLAQPESNRPPSFALTDTMVELAATHGIDLLPVVTYSPPWAAVLPGEEESAPRSPAAYARFVTALVERYGPRGAFWRQRPDLPRRPIRTWQIWNEQSLDWQFKPHEGWEKRYGALLRAASRAIKRADPRATVVLGGMPNIAWADLASLYRRGGIRGYFDAAAVHIYSANPADFVQIVRRFRRTLDRNGGRRVSIYVTEAGASASGDDFRSPGHEHFQVTDGQLARLIPATYRALAKVRRAERLKRVYWYTWASEYQPDWGVFGYSGLNAYSGGDGVQPMPALRGYRSMTAALR